MRFRTIITAAAVPAATAGLLLTTTAAASAATVAPAVTTAVTTKAITPRPGMVVATTHQQGLADTTSVTGAATHLDPVYGPVWAQDNLERVITAVPDKAGHNTWDVTVAEAGTYSAFASPIDGSAWTGHGPFWGYVKYVVQAPAGHSPSAKNLPAKLDPSYRSGNVLNVLFGLDKDSSALIHVPGGDDGQYYFVYYGIPGQPNGYIQHS